MARSALKSSIHYFEIEKNIRATRSLVEAVDEQQKSANRFKEKTLELKQVIRELENTCRNYGRTIDSIKVKPLRDKALWLATFGAQHEG